jgi:hypothetical protein
MKSVIKESLKLTVLAVVVLLGVNSNASAQDARIEMRQLEALAAKAHEKVEVNLDEGVLSFTCKFLSSEDEDEKRVKDLCTGMKGIYVKTYSFENEGQFSEADLESVRSQLRNSSWSRIVDINAKKEGNLEIYLMRTNNQVIGMAMLAWDLKDVTVVNIVGPVDLSKLSQLEGHFGVPELGLTKSKPKPRKKD